MTESKSDLLSQAIAGLRLRDITLYSSKFSRPSPPPDEESFQAAIQTKRQVKFVRGEMKEGADISQLLHVFVELGLRIAGCDGEEPPIYFEIEADFLAEYEIRDELSEAAIKAFAELNSVHNVWPFWRQHVFDIVQRGRMTPVEIPLFAGEPQSQKESRSAVA